jgi:hypothetical protein
MSPWSRQNEAARHRRYVRLCAWLARNDARLPRRFAAWRARADGSIASRRAEALSRSIGQAAIQLHAEDVLAAARFIAALSAVSLAPVVSFLLVVHGPGLALSGVFVLAVLPLVAREAVLSYPKAAAARRASHVTRSSTECVSLMIMSLRHEPSLPKAMAFAAERDSEFAAELRAAIWSVMMGVHSTFEDALNSFGAKWADHSPELKSSVQAMITASCEATQAGSRRALDRANRSIVSGARRRIEEYALSLSVPSMMLFGMGIILPLMVGSFLPLLSWDIWADGLDESVPETSCSVKTMGQVVLLMNVIFPAIAFLVAMDALSRHPLAASGASDGSARRPAGRLAYATVACVASAAGLATSLALLDGTGQHVALLLSVSVPVAASAAIYGASASARAPALRHDPLGDALFCMGASMVEGENFESALSKSVASLPRGAIPAEEIRHHAVGVSGQDAAASAAMGALGVVRDAARKDEAQAGVLAMDLSGYLKEVSELTATMRRKLRPTVSMMRITAHVLAPVVLGITHAIYVSLASIGDATAVPSGLFFMVLGLFLAETNAVVAYFVWGIGERKTPGELAQSVGTCVLVSSLIYSATVAIAS